MCCGVSREEGESTLCTYACEVFAVRKFVVLGGKMSEMCGRGGRI